MRNAAWIWILAVSTTWADLQIFSDSFSTGISTWSYTGAQRAGQDLVRFDPGNQRLAATWDQSAGFAFGDPMTLTTSGLTAPLNRSLSDQDSFRFGATLRIDAGSVPDTQEFYQIASFGLYNPANTGPDRLLADNFSGNSNLVTDGHNLVEFNYFINNRAFGGGFNPNTQPTIITDIPGQDAGGNFVIGNASDSMFNSTDMGSDNYLPVDMDLFVEVSYFGAANGTTRRRAFGAIYTDPQRSTILTVAGVPQFYWTTSVPEDQAFTVSHVGFQNYSGPRFDSGQPFGEGTGSFDDVYVAVVPEPGTGLLYLLGLSLIGLRRLR